jgi:hypothetical protein
LPPAAIRGPDGKPLLSWRVALLPYAGQEFLYKMFKFDEPWDSEHNKQFIDKMPAVFRDPHAAKNSTSSSYYMVTGKGTFGDSENGRRVKEIPDGTSMTIMLVDAKRDVPWTKPEDIEIDADPAKPLPKLGGFLQPEGLFLAAFADGSVRTIPDAINPKTLREFLTVAGGEPVNRDALDPPKPAEMKPADKPRIEFRLGEDQPGDGLTAYDVPGQQKVYVSAKVELTNADIEKVSATTDQHTNAPALLVEFNADGAKKIAKLTEDNLRKKLVILANDKLLAAPIIMSKITTKAQVTGNFSEQEVEQLAQGFNGQ